MSRANALKSLYAILEANAPLVAALGHTVGATTVEAGARIVADYVRLQELPVPCILMTLAPEVPARNVDQMAWPIALQVYAEDVFKVANLVDLIEAGVDPRTSTGYKNDGLFSPPLRLTKIEMGLSSPIAFDQALRAEAIGQQVSVTLHWVK